MGASCRLTGEITFDPPLTWGEYRQSRFRADHGPDTDLQFTELRTPKDTDEGELVIRTALAIEARSLEPGSFYLAKEELEEIVADYGDARTFGGFLMLTDSDNPTGVYRYRIDEDGLVVEERAVMTWPDGTKVEN